MFNLHKNHRNLVAISFVVFVLLSLFIAVMPAYQLQEVSPLPDQPELTTSELNGLHIFISVTISSKSKFKIGSMVIKISKRSYSLLIYPARSEGRGLLAIISG